MGRGRGPVTHLLASPRYGGGGEDVKLVAAE